MGVRHRTLRNTSTLSMWGEIKVDLHGNVHNLEELQALDQNKGRNVREALTNHPDFVDTEAYPDQSKPLTPPAETKKPAVPTEQSQGPSSADYYGLITGLTTGGINTNSEGYVDLDALITACRERGWPILTGTRRKQITDEGRRMEAFAKGQAVGNQQPSMQPPYDTEQVSQESSTETAPPNNAT